jgi:two-component system, sensor histidine kinase PhcS
MEATAGSTSRRITEATSKAPRKRPVLSDPELAKRFLIEDRTITLKNVRALCWIAMILVPLASVLDLIAYPRLFVEFGILRCLSSLALAPILHVTRTAWGQRHYRFLTVAVPMIPAFAISAMIYLSGDPSSSYYAGLTLCLVAIALMFHWTALESCVAVGLVICFYLAANAPALLKGVAPDVMGTFVNNVVFIVLNSVVIISGSFYHRRVRVREFLTRTEVEQQREELSQRNEALITTLRQLRETESQLIQTEKLASLGRMSAGIIHEINNPLNFTNQALFVLKKKGKHLTEDQQESFERIIGDIKEGIGRVSTIVSDLRSFSHPDTGSFAIIKPHDIATNALRLMSQELRDHNVTVHTHFMEDLLVTGDRNQLIQVLINFIQNAIDAMGDRPEQAIWVTVDSENQRAVISVRDNGCGIPAENLSKVFDPFFTTKEVGAGMGMGLAVCYRIIQSMHGSMEVRSKPGQGAEFRVLLPLEILDAPQPPIPPKQEWLTTGWVPKPATQPVAAPCPQ